MTALETKVMDTIGKPNGNGENIRFNDWHQDCMSIFDFGIDNKVLRGVLSSLIKKGYITVSEGEFDTVIGLTDKGLNWYTLTEKVKVRSK